MKRLWLAPFLLLVVACANSATIHDGAILEISVESWSSVDAGPINERIRQAAQRGEDWPRSPARIALEVVGGDAETRSLLLNQSANRMESADEIVITVKRDGLLDDSVRGDWHRIVLVPGDGGAWRVSDLRRAFRCRRREAAGYGALTCP